MTADAQIEATEQWAAENSAKGKPNVVLPSGNVTITDCAEDLFSLIGPTKTLFVRDGVTVQLIERAGRTSVLDILRAAAARSFFEKFAVLWAWRIGRGGRQVLQRAICSQDLADALIQSEDARTMLPSIRGLVNSPIIREVDGRVVPAGIGYDTRTGMFVTGGAAADDVDVDTAVSKLMELLAEFDFQSQGDRARAIASFISPALKLGGFIAGRIPADVAEADQSQAGKTYRQKLLAAIYNEKVSLVTSQAGGVGSVDESFNQQLIAGRPFIQFDNFRGRFDSRHLEAFMTADSEFPCRVPHRGTVSVNPENYFVLLTSNGVDTTRDFANRSNIIRIRKKPEGYPFKSYPEGSLLAHVTANQPLYLGCIFAVIRKWHDAGQPRTEERRHDFREWVQAVDWIVRNVFNLVPVMEGHLEAQERVSNPGLVWLRSMTQQVDQSGALNQPLTATQIHDLCQTTGVAVPGVSDIVDEAKAAKTIGCLMGRLFKDTDKLEVDAYQITKGERSVKRDDPGKGGSYKSKVYIITKLGGSISKPQGPQ